MLTSGVTTRQAAAEPSETPPTRPSRWLSTAIVVALGALIIEVLLESWLVVRLGHGSGTAFVEAEWPKTLKTLLYVILLGLAAAKFTVDRAWHQLRTWADVALVAVVIVMAVAGNAGGSSTVLIGQALFVYFRGAIVFYAMRALAPDWRTVRPLAWIGGVIIALSSLIGMAQFFFGKRLYSGLGWVNLQWAQENRAQGLFDHPNNLGHLAGFMLLGLLAWIMTVEKVGWRWWTLFVLIAFAVGVAQSRQSTIFVLGGVFVIAVLRRAQWRRLIASGLIVLSMSALPVAVSPQTRGDLAYRFKGLLNAFLLSGKAIRECQVDPTCAGKDDAEIRILFIQQGLTLWKASPVLGYGVGQFGGIVAVKNDPQWNLDPRFQKVLGPGGFELYQFKSKSVDVFWLHLLVEAGALGMLAYLIWMGLVALPLVRTAWQRGRKMGGVRGSPSAGTVVLWACSVLGFGMLIAAWSSALEDPVFPPLLFAVLGLAWALVPFARGSGMDVAQERRDET